jgi:hypothetical protein
MGPVAIAIIVLVVVLPCSRVLVVLCPDSMDAVSEHQPKQQQHHPEAHVAGLIKLLAWAKACTTLLMCT